MTITINIPETADQLTELITRVQSGEEIIFTQDGVAIARLVSIQRPNQPRTPGQDKGKVAIASDFNTPLPDNILNDFFNSDFPTS